MTVNIPILIIPCVCIYNMYLQIDERFRIKLADYGLARCIAPPLYDNGNEE